jgi:oligopeptidase A
MSNPLLDFSGLPRFDAVTPSHVTPAIEALIQQCELALDLATLPETPATWDDAVAPLSEATERLTRAWNVVQHLHAVVDTPELRATYTDNLPKVTAFWTRLGADERLYAKYKAIRAGAAFDALDAERRRSVEQRLRDFRLSGAELEGAARQRHAAIKAEQARLAQQFSEHLLDATDAYAYYATADELAGVPQDVQQAARDAAAAEGRDGHKLTLHMPCYLPVMQYAHDGALRERLYRAYGTRASEFGDSRLDNTAIIPALLALRAEECRLLGFDTYAQLSLQPKMAERPEQVIDFIRDIARRARPYGERDMQTLREYARTRLGLADVQPWDIAYVSEKLREAQYSYSDQEVKQYFTEPKVVAGLFKVVETLFGVQICPAEAPVWHADVRFYRITSSDGRVIGEFYMDLYARPGKQPGAWMDIARERRLRAGGALQTPVCYLTCNFAAPVGGKPALLSHDEVQTLFHEFGHGLHLLLTQVGEPSVGMGAVEWDAIELPSQFMENFCWEWDVVRHMTAHVDTGAPLPRELFERMLAAKNFQAGMQTLRQMEFALFDMRLHHGFDATQGSVQALLDEVRREVAVVIPPGYHRFQNSFSHIFGGSYAAGYYSYKWAEVLSADAYSLFEETGVLNPQTGARFRDEILGAGARRSAMESFTAFRGRAPRIDALLRHQGMMQ